jgi:HEAT repeat protein
MVPKIALALWKLQRCEEASGVVFDPRQEGMDLLIDSLGSDRPIEQRLWAITVLGELGSEANPAAHALLPALKHEDSALWAIQTLESIGPSAHAAGPALRDVLRSDHVHLHYSAALALCKIEGLHGAAMAYLKDSFERDLTDAIYLDNALSTVGRDARIFIPPLLRSALSEKSSVLAHQLDETGYQLSNSA